MHIFPSIGWVKAFVKAVNSSKEFKINAGKWKGDFLFVIESDPDQNLESDFRCHIILNNGKCEEAKVYSEGSELPTVTYRLIGSYKTWKRVIVEQLDPGLMIIKGELRLRGPVKDLMNFLPAVRSLLDCVPQVPTQFIDATPNV